MDPQLLGIHHLTAVTANAKANKAFYTDVLGMRLVKKTVNQDDVSAYHLFYADGVGSPGTDITFFEWALPREVRGTRSIISTGLRVRNDAALLYWSERLRKNGAVVGELDELLGRTILDVEDPEGQRLRLTVHDGARGIPWALGPVPEENQVLGLGPITLSIADPGPTRKVLTEVLGMRDLGEPETGLSVFEMGNGGPSAELHVLAEPRAKRAVPGAGGAHHVAFRVRDEDYGAWSEKLQRLGIRTSGPVDRFYFRSLYFREPGGVLFELATDGPGFASDEHEETLGEKLSLPPFLEGRRREIEARLDPL